MLSLTLFTIAWTLLLFFGTIYSTVGEIGEPDFGPWFEGFVVIAAFHILYALTSGKNKGDGS